MALSQTRCLDDNNVNPRVHESKPDFLYCENQRLALELLLADGREAFADFLSARGLRNFLSDLEQETLTGAVEPFVPGSELSPGSAGDAAVPLSLHYCPDVSDVTAPEMELGWPDGGTYRGVTRTSVYTQPPLDGQTHVKEVVRKMIAQAQRVIAVVMDVFTDVDIFRDLIEAGFRRKVSVYILLEHAALPHFLSMCRGANMHAGHLKHLRVRCVEGTEFYTRSCTKVKGRMGHRFMFIDGDKAVSGSYSFTWTSSRLDRTLITVVTGQGAESFDRLFLSLYLSSSSVHLLPLVTLPEPEPEPVLLPPHVAPPPADIARKLYNPKYALVTAATALSGPAPSNPQTPPSDPKRSKGADIEAPPAHPGLAHLEKVCLISYLPTWPEPDPPSDIIGYVNVRGGGKPTPVHLQRSEMFESSWAIRFRQPPRSEKETPKVDWTPPEGSVTDIKSEHTRTGHILHTHAAGENGHTPSSSRPPSPSSPRFLASSLVSTPPIPKPRTLHLPIKGGGDLMNISVAKSPVAAETNAAGPRGDGAGSEQSHVQRSEAQRSCDVPEDDNNKTMYVAKENRPQTISYGEQMSPPDKPLRLKLPHTDTDTFPPPHTPDDSALSSTSEEFYECFESPDDD